ncbi:MAG: hypothetical protein R3B68_14285 [Phycisphaerales bacterium]
MLQTRAPPILHSSPLPTNNPKHAFSHRQLPSPSPNASRSRGITTAHSHLAASTRPNFDQSLSVVTTASIPRAASSTSSTVADA